MSLPVGYGKANNPTGKGLVHSSENTHRNNRKMIAGQRLTTMMIDIILEDSENGKSRAENAVRAQAQLAEKGDLWALKFFTERIMGMPTQAVTVAGTEDGEPIRHIVEFVIVDPVSRTT